VTFIACFVSFAKPKIKEKSLNHEEHEGHEGHEGKIKDRVGLY